MTGTGRDADPATLAIQTLPSPPDGWDDLLARDPQAEYSHTVHWLEAAARTLPGLDTRYICARRDGRLVGGLPVIVRAPTGMLGRGGQESSFAGTSGGPVIDRGLSDDATDDVFGRLVAAFAARRRAGLDSCSLVLGPANERRFTRAMATGGRWTRTDAPTAAVDLTGGFTAVERDRIRKNKRNERNRALRRGLTIITTRDSEHIAAYHQLHVAACAVWGIEPTPRAFLDAVLADPDCGSYFTCAIWDGKVVGGHLCLHRGARVLAWHGVTDPALARTHFPATALVCADLEEACRRGAAWLDLGGSGHQGSLAGFKKYFGAEVQMRGLYRCEPLALKLVRRGREAIDRLGARRSAGRWHAAGREDDGA